MALLRARVAALRSKEASFEARRADLVRARGLFSRSALSREDFDQRLEAERTAAAAVKQALEEVHEARVSLGLPPHPEKGELTDVPADINQTFSGVRQALADVNQSMAQLGFPLVSVSRTPQQALEEFARRDKEGNIDRILERMVPGAPAVRQAEAKRLQALRDLAEAELDLRYCDIVSEIDGVVTSRSVNPGNHVSAGQSLMAVRSLTEIWVDANFKETQLADLRIGQRVRCEVDMYGGRKEFEGRITGFTMGTGQTLSPAAAERHRQLREDRPAAAGPHRAGRLRPRQGPPVRRPVGGPVRVLQGAADGPERRGGLATTGPPSDGPDGPQALTRIGRKARVKSDGSGVPADAHAHHGRGRPALRQSAGLRHGDPACRARRREADPKWSRALGFWKSTAVMAIVTAITAAAHLTQIALWAATFLLCGQASTLETALYVSAQSYTALGYGDVLLSERWRLLGPLEAINGLLFFGLSTAVLFAIMSQLIERRLRTEAGYQGGVAGNQAPLSSADDTLSKRAYEILPSGRSSTSEDAS